MDLDKYIGENIDEILDNPDEYVFNNIINKKPFQTNNKKVSFDSEQIKKKNNNSDSDYDNSDYYDKIYGDVYDNDFDDFGYIYKKNNSDNSDNSDNEYNQDNEDNNKDYNNNFYQEIIKEPNEDDYTEDNIGELYQDMYESKMQNNDINIDIVDVFKNLSQSDLNKLNENDKFDNFHKLQNIKQTNVEYENNIKIKNNDENNDDFKDDDGYYFINLINIFIKYYNNKFDKIENFFSGIKNDDKDTTSQMELFFDAVVEYKTVKELFGLDDTQCMGLIFLDSNSNDNTNTNDDIDRILELFSKCENQIYMLDLGNNRYISPSLLVCLNYIYEKQIIDEHWNIYNLRNI